MSSDLQESNENAHVGEQEEAAEDSSVLNYKDWSGIDVIEGSLCMECGGTGKTMLMLHKIPFFREIIIGSFKCNQCHARNNEVTFGGEIQPKGLRIEFQVTTSKDLNRQIVKSDSASVVIPALEFEIPPGTQKGEITTLEGIITQAAKNLGLYQAERMEQTPEIGVKVAMVIMQLMRYASGDILPFTIILDDCSGNSFIENPSAPALDPLMIISKYDRTAAQDISLGLNPEQQGTYSNDKQSGNFEQLFDKPFGGVKADEKRAPYHVTETEDEVRLGRDEVLSIPEFCPNCNKLGDCKTAMTSIPHFKEVVIMAFTCAFCGYRTNEVKGGGAIPAKGTQISLTVGSEEDLKRDVLKGQSAMLLIPEIELELSHGSLGGVYTTVEGLMHKIYTNLRDNNPFAVGDSITKHHSDEQDTSKREFVDYLTRLKDMCDGKIYPFTLILRDPLGNSFISAPLGSFLPPESDAPLHILDYERSFDENDEFGINDMNTQDFETLGEFEQHREQYYNKEHIQPDIKTHVLPKGPDHPLPFAQGVMDSTAGGRVFASSLQAQSGHVDACDETSEEFLQPPEGYSAGRVAKGGLEDFPEALRMNSTSTSETTDVAWTLPEDYGKRHLGDDSALIDRFEAREEFAGRREGFVYKLGSLGLGYYPDVRKIAANHP